MFRQLFDQLNAYLLTHPAMLSKLQLLFWIKYWCLIAIMLFFLYLVYFKNDAKPAAKKKKRDTFRA